MLRDATRRRQRRRFTTSDALGVLLLVILTTASIWPSATGMTVVPVWRGENRAGGDVHVHAHASWPVGENPECPGARPGAVVEMEESGGATLNFVFKGSDGRRYIGAAGHTVLDDGGSQTWLPGTGPEAFDANLERIGEAAYASHTHGEKETDFALIRLDRGIEWSPELCHYGGPTGVNRDQTSNPLPLHFYGNGRGVTVRIGGTESPRNPVPARSLAAFGMPHPRHVYAWGPAVPGDSGSPVISDDGRAVGILVAVGVFSPDPETMHSGPVQIMRVAPQIKAAEALLGIRLKLEKA